MARLTPLYAVPAPDFDVPEASRIRADHDGGISLQALNKGGGSFSLYLMRQGSSQIWYKTSYGATLTNAGASAYVRVPPAEVMVGERWAVWTDRPSNVAFVDEAHVISVGLAVDPNSHAF